MEATAEKAQARLAPTRDPARDDAGWRQIVPDIAGCAIPFALVLYLALRGGGYDEVIRSEVGVALWLLIAVGAVLGLLPLARPGRAAWYGLALLAALTAWTAASMLWSESVENSYAEVARLLTYLGAFAYALSVQGPGGARRAVIGVGAAIGFTAALALLSRFHPGWFPANEYAEVFPEQRSRLNYPLNYPNGLAAFIAMGVPLFAAMGVDGRRLGTRAVATATVPVLGLAIFLTYSRGSLLIAGIALVALLILHPRRGTLAVTLALGGLGTALSIVALTRREELKDGLLTETAGGQGDEMIVITLLVCAAIGVLRVLFEAARRRGVGRGLRVSPPGRRQGLIAAGAAGLIVVVAALAAGAPAELADRWEEFKEPAAAAGSTERFGTATGNGRYQYWGSAIDAFESEPVAGTGAGTYEYWWLRNGSLPGPIRDAHSLYFETLGELGVVGFILLLALVGLVLAVGVMHVRNAPPAARGYLAAALAAALTFVLAAGADWMWEIPVIPVAFLLLAATLLATPREEGAARDERGTSPAPPSRRRRLAGAAVALVPAALLVLAIIPARDIREADSALARSDPEAAVSAARDAQDLQPFAATPYMREALALHALGDYDAALAPALAATEKEPTNWRTWHLLWQVETAGATNESDRSAARATYEKARSLNPRSGSFLSAEDLGQ